MLKSFQAAIRSNRQPMFTGCLASCLFPPVGCKTLKTRVSAGHGMRTTTNHKPVRAHGCIPSATGESEQLRGNSKTHLRGFLWGHANWPSGHPRQNQCQKQSHHPTQFYEPVCRTGVSYRSIGEGLLGGAWATTGQSLVLSPNNTP